MNNNTLLGIYADIQEVAGINIVFADNSDTPYGLGTTEEEACRRAQKKVKAIHSEPDPEPPKPPINWMNLQKEEEYIPKEINWAMTFYRRRTNLKQRWTKMFTRSGGKS